MVVKTIDILQLKGRIDTTVFSPIQHPGLAAYALSSQSLVVYEVLCVLRVYTMVDSGDFHLLSLNQPLRTL